MTWCIKDEYGRASQWSDNPLKNKKRERVREGGGGHFDKKNGKSWGRELDVTCDSAAPSSRNACHCSLDCLLSKSISIESRLANPVALQAAGTCDWTIPHGKKAWWGWLSQWRRHLVSGGGGMQIFQSRKGMSTHQGHSVVFTVLTPIQSPYWSQDKPAQNNN